MSCALTSCIIRGKSLNMAARVMYTGEPENVCQGLVSKCVTCTTNDIMLFDGYDQQPSALPEQDVCTLAMLVELLGRHEMGIVRLVALDMIARRQAAHVYTYQCVVGRTWPWQQLAFRVPHRCCHKRCTKCAMCTRPTPHSIKQAMD